MEKMPVILALMLAFYIGILMFSTHTIETVTHIVYVKNVERTVQQEIVYQSKMAAIDPELSLRVAKCESELNPYAQNPNSSAKGLYQFIDSTWYSYCDGDVLNYKDNTACFVKLFPIYPSWWEESKSCWNK